MTKQEAVQIFGETQADLARALGVSKSYISLWPAQLTERQQDWVLGAAVRLGKEIPDELRDRAA